MTTKTDTKPADAPEITDTPENAKPAPATPAAAAFIRHPDAKEGTCGFPVALAKDGVTTHKPCLKDPGHQGQHSSRKYVKADERVISADTLKLDAFGADEPIIAQDAERSELQKQTDRQVAAVHKAWVDAKKPAGVVACKKAGVLARFWIEPQQADTVRVLLRKAGQFNGVHVKILPVQKHQSGRYMIPWVAVDKRVTSARSAS